MCLDYQLQCGLFVFFSLLFFLFLFECDKVLRDNSNDRKQKHINEGCRWPAKLSGLIRCMFWPTLSDLHQNEFCRLNCVVVLFF